MLLILLSLLAAQTQTPPRTLEELRARLCPPLETHLLDADEKKIVVAIAEHYRKYEWTREQGFVEASTGRHAVASLKSPSVFVDRSLPVAVIREHGIEVKLQSHGVAPTIAAELLASMRANNAAYKTFDTTGLSLVPFHCDDFASLMMRAPLPPGRDMTNAGTAISMSVPAFDAARTHALVLSVNDLEWLLGHGVREMELSLLTKSNDKWVVTWHTVIGGWARGREEKMHETPVTADDRAVFDAMLARLVTARIPRGQCVRIINESRNHDAEEIASADTWTKRGGGIAEAFQDMATRSPEFIGDYKPRVRSELVATDVTENQPSNRLGSCGGVVSLTLPGFSRDRDTAVSIYWIDYATDAGTEIGDGTMLLRRNGTTWEVAEDNYQWGAREPKAKKK